MISLFPLLHTPFPPFSPSLISLMVSVDVKHHGNSTLAPLTVVVVVVGGGDVEGAGDTLRAGFAAEKEWSRDDNTLEHIDKRN